VLFIGWRYWAIGQDSAKLDADITAAQKEAVRLSSLINQVQVFEQQKTQLQQRVTLIEQLRKDQSGPVHMLDQISRAMPSMLWLTELKQSPNPSEVLINGKCTSITSLTDFVGTLEASGYFKKSVEIVDSRTEPATTSTPVAMVSFSIRAQFQRPGDAAKVLEAAPARVVKS
jgi:type IV pilus assembly protein PilN